MTAAQPGMPAPANKFSTARAIVLIKRRGGLPNKMIFRGWATHSIRRMIS
jgi:hypothetical protein